MPERTLSELRRSLKRNAYPLVEVRGGRVCPGASLWTGGVEVAERLAAAGVGAGDRVAVCLPNGVEFVQALLGCLRLHATFAPIPWTLREDAAAFARRDPKAILSGSLEPETRPARRPPCPELRVLFATSGSTGHGTLVGLSDENLAHQIATHAPLLDLRPGDRVVGYLSWAHAFGGVLELLTGLVSGAHFVLPCAEGYRVDALADALREEPCALFTVPKVLRDLAERDDAAETLGNVRNGIVGGAPLTAPLVEALHRFGCGLRAGYGQTECSPGVMLGPAGVFDVGLLGRPVGCEVRVLDGGDLWVRGPNVAAAVWDGPPHLLGEGGWLATGDRVSLGGDGLYRFAGRQASGWKTSNGRMVLPGEAEAELGRSLGCEVLLLKSAGDSAVPVVIGDPPTARAALPRTLGATALVLEPPVVVPYAEVVDCTLPSGKWATTRLAERLRNLMPTLELDPILYPRPSEPVRVAVGKGATLDPRELVRASQAERLRPELGREAEEAVERAHAFALAKAAADAPIYGWKTGFGPLVAFAADEDPEEQSLRLLCHLQAGQGPALPAEVVRAMLLLRLHTVAQGHSGISPEAARWLCEALGRGVAPAVPRMGSVGASGDLIPMAHAVAALRGEGELLPPGPASLEEAALSPLPLQGRDALALVNGTPLMSALGSHAWHRATLLARAAIRSTALAYDLLGCHDQPLQESLHRGSGHDTHAAVAAQIAELLAGWTPDPGRPLQESYSLRCAPQLLGAVQTVLDQVEETLTRELNGVSDNPFFDPESDDVIHGGNFFGQEVAFAMDHLANAIVQMANLAERQLALLVEPQQTGLPLLLSARPGAWSGLAGVQLAATATVAEMRRRSVPASVQTLPTNGMNQDIVPLGTHAALNAYELAEMAETVVGSLALALRQAFYLAGRAPGGKHGPWVPGLLDLAPVAPDRPLSADVRRAAALVLA